GRLDPRTGKMEVFESPRGRGPYGIHVTPDGTVYYASLAGSHIAKLDSATGKWSAWRAPGDDPHVYAVYVDETDKVWASEWSAQAMLRFDPATEKFESFRSSSRNANVRQIHGRKGEVWTPESAADKVVVYRYK